MRGTHKPGGIITLFTFILTAVTAAVCFSHFDARAEETEAASPFPTYSLLQDEKYDNLGEEPDLSGGEVRFLANQGGLGQQLSAVFRSSDGHVIVVDGGRDEDSEHLISVIKEFGGYVDCWLITHPQADHVGALRKILCSEGRDIGIGSIYCHFLDQSWYDEVDPAEAGVVYVLRERLAQLKDTAVHDDCGRGTERLISDRLSFRVLNDPHESGGDFAINASGLMYDIFIDGKHFIILGDMSADMGDILMAEGVLDGIVCDYVQISHHGQRGVSREFYRALAPKNCIWPTNAYIYLAAGINSSGLDTRRVKIWIAGIGSVKHNYVTLGRDVIIR